jgi:hypothetical protein
MKCSTSDRPLFDLSQHPNPRALPVAILRFIRGVRGPRNVPVTRKQIGVWLRATPAAAVDAALLDLATEGKITSRYNSLRGRNAERRAIVYELDGTPVTLIGGEARR